MFGAKLIVSPLNFSLIDGPLANLKFRLSFVLVCFLASLSGLVCHASEIENKELGDTLDSLRRTNLGRSEEWKAILLYHSNLIGDDTGLIDSEGFYLSPRGQYDSEAELDAFIRALYQRKKQVQCRFPRRFAWVQQKLSLQGLSEESCPPNPQVPQRIESLYLAFSSYFLESPASFFGHLFFRYRLPVTQTTSNSHLDPVINYSAVHGDVDYFSYMWGGLTGQFPGVFEILPMHIKIQQYNNHESRDIWEFPLKLSERQLVDLLLTTREILPFYSDYYYLSRNCSLLLAKLIQTVEPRIKLGAAYRVWSTPFEIMQKLVRELGSANNYIFTPSNRTKYMSMYSSLNVGEEDVMIKILKESEIKALENLNPSSQARVLDTLLEFIDFDNRLSGPKAPERYGKLRQKALISRADNPIISDYKTNNPHYHENPMYALPEQKLGLGYLTNGTKSYLQLNWRPTLKDLISSSRGFKQAMGMSMFDLYVTLNEDQLDIRTIDFLKVENYEPNLPFKRLINIGVRFSYGHYLGNPSNAKGFEAEASINQGFDWRLLSSYIELGTNLFSTTNKSFGSKASLTSAVGFIHELLDWYKIHAKVGYEYWSGKLDQYSSVEIGFNLPANLEITIGLQKRQRTQLLELAVNSYF